MEKTRRVCLAAVVLFSSMSACSQNSIPGDRLSKLSSSKSDASRNLGTSQSIFYVTTSDSQGIYKFDKATHESQLIASNPRYAGLATPRGEGLWLDISEELRLFNEPHQLWFVSSENQLFRYDAETDRSVPIETSMNFADTCDRIYTQGDSIELSLTSENCETFRRVDLYTGEVSDPKTYATRSRIVFGAQNRPVGTLSYTYAGGGVDYTDADGHNYHFEIPPVDGYDFNTAYDNGSQIVVLAQAYPTREDVGDVVRFRFNKLTGEVTSELLKQNVTVMIQPLEGSRTVLSVTDGTSQEVLYESLDTPSLSTMLPSALDFRASPGKVAVLYDDRLEIFDLGLSADLKESRIFQKTAASAYSVYRAGSNFIFEYEDKMDRIDSTTLQVSTFKNTYLRNVIGSGRYAYKRYRDLVYDFTHLPEQEIYLTDPNPDVYKDGWQGFQLGIFHDGRKDLEVVGTIGDILSFNAESKSVNFYLAAVTLAAKTSEGQTRPGLFWLDGETHEMGEMEIPGSAVIFGPSVYDYAAAP